MGSRLRHSPATQDLDVDECAGRVQILDQLALCCVVGMDGNPLPRERLAAHSRCIQLWEDYITRVR
jgi:hypothetical protein